MFILGGFFFRVDFPPLMVDGEDLSTAGLLHLSGLFLNELLLLELLDRHVLTLVFTFLLDLRLSR